MRLCAIGDSFVNGTGDPDGLGWVGRIASSRMNAGSDLTVYNLGVRGDTSADILARFEREAAVRTGPGFDVRLLFSFGVNDCCPEGETGAPRLRLEETVANAAEIFRIVSAFPVLMVGPPPIADDTVNARLAALDPALAEVSEAAGIPYLGVFGPLRESDIWSREVAARDGAHPGAEGYAVLAGLVEGWSSWQDWFA